MQAVAPPAAVRAGPCGGSKWSLYLDRAVRVCVACERYAYGTVYRRARAGTVSQCASFLERESACA